MYPYLYAYHCSHVIWNHRQLSSFLLCSTAIQVTSKLRLWPALWLLQPAMLCNRRILLRKSAIRGTMHNNEHRSLGVHYFNLRGNKYLHLDRNNPDNYYHDGVFNFSYDRPKNYHYNLEYI